MLQEEESENYYAVGRAEREEFLFRLFKHLCLGGELCQYEDTVEPYISTTRRIYKDLIRSEGKMTRREAGGPFGGLTWFVFLSSVQKEPETKKISVVSTVLKVFARVSVRPYVCQRQPEGLLTHSCVPVQDESGRCFPGRPEEEQTFAYLIVDPHKRHVTLFSHIYGVGDLEL